MKPRFSFVACAVALLAAVMTSPPAADADPYAEFDPDLRLVLKRFDAAQADVESLSASFIERKEIGLLKNAVVQQGRFYHSKPDKFLWEYVKPEPKMLLMNGPNLVAYYPRQKEAEEIRTRLSRKLVRYFGLGQVFLDLRKHYHLSLGRDNDVPGTELIVMTPRSQSIAKRLLEVRIWLDQQVNQIARLEYMEVDGDLTQYVFEDVRVNPEISEDRYRIDLPADVRISNSFSGFFSEKGR